MTRVCISPPADVVHCSSSQESSDVVWTLFGLGENDSAALTCPFRELQASRATSVKHQVYTSNHTSNLSASGLRLGAPAASVVAAPAACPQTSSKIVRDSLRDSINLQLQSRVVCLAGRYIMMEELRPPATTTCGSHRSRESCKFKR